MQKSTESSKEKRPRRKSTYGLTRDKSSQGENVDKGDDGYMQKSTERTKEKRPKRKSTYGQTLDKKSTSSQGENVDKGDDGYMQKSTERTKEKRPKRKSTYGQTLDKKSTSSQGENVDKGDDGYMQKSTERTKEKRPKRKSTYGQTLDKKSTSSQGENVDKGDDGYMQKSTERTKEKRPKRKSTYGQTLDKKSTSSQGENVDKGDDGYMQKSTERTKEKRPKRKSTYGQTLDKKSTSSQGENVDKGDDGYMQKSTERTKEKRPKRKSTYGQTLDKKSTSSQGENVDKGDDGYMQKSTERTKEKRPKRKSTYGQTLDKKSTSSQGENVDKGDDGYMQKSTERTKEKRPKRKSTYGQTLDKKSTSSQGENVDKGDDGYMQKSTERTKEKRPKRKSTYGQTLDKKSTSSQGENVDKGDDGYMQKSTETSKEKRPKRKSTYGQTLDKKSTSSQGENVDKEKRDRSVPMKNYTKEYLYHLSTKLSESLKRIEKNAKFIVWPGTDLAKHKTVFVCLYQGVMQKTEQKYEGIHIYYKDSETPSRPLEPSHELPIDSNLTLCHKDAEILQQIIKEQGSILFEQHSNLEAITGSSFILSKRRGYTKCPSVVLYCQVKGIVPIGEDAFPTTLKAAKESIRINVDVREGYLRQGMNGRGKLGRMDYHDKLCMGISIGVQNGGIGTLGPFVKKSDGDVGFLTCAHVILSDPDNQPALQLSKGHKVFQPADGESHPDFEKHPDARYCGTVSEIVFNPKICDPINRLPKTVGVDAALVTVSNRDKDVKNFPFIPVRDLKNAGFDPHESPMFGHGSVAQYPLDFKNYQGKRVIKYGRTSGLTKGSLSLDGGQIKSRNAKLQLPDNGKFVIMEGQYIVERHGMTTFFQLGDSGSGVFVLDQENKLTCIGLAIGRLDDWQTVVTPIEYVLKALGLELDSMILEEDMDVQ